MKPIVTSRNCPQELSEAQCRAIFAKVKAKSGKGKAQRVKVRNPRTGEILHTTKSALEFAKQKKDHFDNLLKKRIIAK